MKFIEIKPGELSVARKEIIAIERRDDAFSSVHTESSVFEAELPYEVLVQMLESSDDQDSSDLREMAKSLKVLQDNSQRFGG